MYDPGCVERRRDRFVIFFSMAPYVNPIYQWMSAQKNLDWRHGLATTHVLGSTLATLKEGFENQ